MPVSVWTFGFRTLVPQARVCLVFLESFDGICFDSSALNKQQGSCPNEALTQKRYLSSFLYFLALRQIRYHRSCRHHAGPSVKNKSAFRALGPIKPTLTSMSQTFPVNAGNLLSVLGNQSDDCL